MRLFVAIFPPAGFVNKLKNFRYRFHHRPEVVWVRPKNYHLTLIFFGEVKKGNSAKIGNLIRRATKNFPPFTLVGDRFGCLGKNLVLFFLIPRRINQLAEHLRRGTADLRISFDAKRFRPHLTLGRFKNLNDPKRVQSLTRSIGASNLSFGIKAIDLIESRGTRGLSVYRRRARFSLSG